MNKKLLYSTILNIFGIYILTKKSIIQTEILKKYGPARLNKFNQVLNSLQKLNLSDLKLKFLMAQVLVETGFFDSKSKVYDMNNNASGILYTGSVPQLKNGAKKGTARPFSEKGFYAKFDSLDNWAKEYYRILNKNNSPLDSLTIIDFVNKLKQNNYFTDTLEHYTNSIKYFYDFLIKNKF